MIAYNNGEWRICKYLIKYTQYGQKRESYALEKSWWLDFAEKWEHTTIDEIIDVVATEEQIERYNQIRNMPEDFHDIYEKYVEFGYLPEPEKIPSDHKFNIILNSIKVQATSDYLVDVDYRIACIKLGI